MEKGKQTFYITTPIFYPNANLHMGHAYTTTLVDIIARYHRLRGDEVFFLTGADENTEKVVRAAKTAGMEPRVYLDDIVTNFEGLFERLNISYDQFIRTSDQEMHWPGVQEMWKRLVAAGDIEKRTYKGFYCVGHEAFVTEKELLNGKCSEHGEKPQEVSEENYFFRLSKYTSLIKEKIESGKLEIIPETRRNEILALLDRGLEDISFSRPADKVSVGVPVPGDPTQKVYVWGDALVNYISALGFGREDSSPYQRFWPADVHVIGKDILRFHAAIWPAMLLSAKLPLPKRLLVHGFITSGGKKMSKTLGNVIDPNELMSEYGAEAVRFFLARHISPFEDGDLTVESFKESYNADLANGLGNLVSRVMKMAETHLEQPVDTGGEIYPTLDYKREFDSLDVQKAAQVVLGYITGIDHVIQTHQPFKLIKEDKQHGMKLIVDLVKMLYIVADKIQVFMPETSKRIKNLIKENKMPSEPLFPRKS
ncbi:MAG: methionine--tRNA ligase [bacterium]|nr:methionine--tRNA ligase [bacterium]